jgi:hypothetical protein
VSKTSTWLELDGGLALIAEDKAATTLEIVVINNSLEFAKETLRHAEMFIRNEVIWLKDYKSWGKYVITKYITMDISGDDPFLETSDPALVRNHIMLLLMESLIGREPEFADLIVSRLHDILEVW